MPERWTRAVLRHRTLVVVAWLIVLAVGVLASTRLPALSSNTFSVPGTDSERARMRAGAVVRRAAGRHVHRRLPGRARPSDKGTQREARQRLERAAGVIPGATARELRAARGIVYGDIATPLPLQEAKGRTDDLRAALRDDGGTPALVTGPPALQRDLDPIVSADLRRAELIALPIALAVLVALLGLSAAVLIPFLFAACTIAGALTLVYLLAHVVSMATYVTNLVVLIGLALAIDYSLLVVYRLPHGARTGLVARGRSRPHDGDRRQGGRLLRARGRDRPERAARRPGPVHPVAGNRRAARPARLARRRGDAPAGPARPSRRVRGRRRRCTRPPAERRVGAPRRDGDTAAAG